jgi:hypothetical protein
MKAQKRQFGAWRGKDKRGGFFNDSNRMNARGYR